MFLYQFFAVVVLSHAVYGENGNENPEDIKSLFHGSGRLKRDLATHLSDSLNSFGGLGDGYLKKFTNLVQGVPPKMRTAFIEQDFSNITEKDIQALNVSVIEYIPPNVLSKMNLTLLTPIIEKLLQFNKPNALGRLLSITGDKMNSSFLLDKIKESGGVKDGNEEAANVLLYSAVSRLGDQGGITVANVQRLSQENLLQLVPEEQLMKVKDASAARFILTRMYSKLSKSHSDNDDLDDKALIYKLVESGYGKAENWSSLTMTKVDHHLLTQMPSEFLKNFTQDFVKDNIGRLRNIKFETPLQSKSITDSYVSNSGIEEGHHGAHGEGHEHHGKHHNPSQEKLTGIMQQLGDLSAFVNPKISTEPSFLNTIIQSSNKLNLPAPFEAIKNFLVQKVGNNGLKGMSKEDIERLGIATIKNGPPKLVEQAIKTKALDEQDLREISKGTNSEQGGFNSISSSFFQGIISQVASYAVEYFTKGGRIDFSLLPASFMGAIGIKGMQSMNNRELEDAILKLKKDPDALDDAQKAIILKKLKDGGMLDSTDLPPEFRDLLPRQKNVPKSILDGLPSDSELRLAYGQRKKITAADLEKDKFLVGTLTPDQVNQLNVEDIPAVLAVVRKSKDGPQTATLEALSKRFSEYLRVKSEDYEAPDKKLLKYITAAEVSKLPATVLAYFIDHRQTSKLPADVRKEIMIALGELSTKDHASIPSKTREEMILQGLKALDEYLDNEKKLDVPELAAIGNGVADLPPERISQLTPVAVEQALDIIQGTADDDDDGLRQRACLKPQQRKAWRKKIIENYGLPEEWDSPTVTSLCCSLGLLDEDDLRKISPESLATCKCPSDAKPPSHLTQLKKSLDENCKYELGGNEPDTKKALEKVKSEIAFDLSDLESQIVRRKRSTNELTCFAVRIAGTAAQFSKQQLESIKENDIANCLYELGVDPLGLEYDRILWKKLVIARGGVANISADTLKYSGFILTGISLSDVGKLNLKDPDVRTAFGRPLGLSKNVLEKLATNLELQISKPLSQLDSTDLVTSGNILCGLSPERIQEIRPDAFKEALPVLKNLDTSCEQTRVAAFSSILLKPEVLGNPKDWTSADVRAAGILFTGLAPPTIEAIPPASFLGITPKVSAALPEAILNLLSPAQVKFIPRFSAQAMSEQQKSAIKEESRESLESVMKGPIVADGATGIHQTSLLSLLSLAITAIIAHRIL